jgi:cytochrome c553
MAAMKAIAADPTQGAKYGLLPVTKDTCAKCHNEKGTSGKFVSWPADSVKIAHPVPAGAAAE